MRGFTVLAATCALAAADKIGDVFDGCYPDPEHPIGWRYIEMWEKYDAEKGRWGVSYGSIHDPKLGPEWNWYIWANKFGDTDTIQMDQSSTGGSKALNGAWDKETNSIKWDDGQVWTKNDAKILDCKQHKYLSEEVAPNGCTEHDDCGGYPVMCNPKTDRCEYDGPYEETLAFYISKFFQ